LVMVKQYHVKSHRPRACASGSRYMAALLAHALDWGGRALRPARTCTLTRLMRYSHTTWSGLMLALTGPMACARTGLTNRAHQPYRPNRRGGTETVPSRGYAYPPIHGRACSNARVRRARHAALAPFASHAGACARPLDVPASARRREAHQTSTLYLPLICQSVTVASACSTGILPTFARDSTTAAFICAGILPAGPQR